MEKYLNYFIRFLKKPTFFINKFLKNPIRFYKSIKQAHNREKSRQSIHKNGSEILHIVSAVFKELNIPYWIDGGTLLGCVRENQLLGHDDDIDIGIFLSDYTKEMEKKFVKYGFKKYYTCSVNNTFTSVETYTYKNACIDIVNYKVEGDYKCFYELHPTKGESLEATQEKLGGLNVLEFRFPIMGLKHKNFLGVDVFVPEDEDKHLKTIYGNYKIENTEWTTNEALNVKFLEGMIGQRKQFSQTTP